MSSRQTELPVDVEIADDIHAEPEEFVHLSDVFKFISHYRLRGHQIGRKVGDMLEIITLAALYLDRNAKARLVLEPKLIGFSGAGHKVEFGIFHLNDAGTPHLDMSKLAGFIECKKVGVEQTIDSGHKRRHGGGSQIIAYGTPIRIRLAPRWAEACEFAVTFRQEGRAPTMEVRQNDRICHSSEVREGSRLIVGLTVSGAPFLVENERSLRDVAESIRACRVLEIASHSIEGVNCILNTCLAGPQTPEKAKQASFVALDVRKGLFRQFDKRPGEIECVSVLVLTEFSHWEAKSINMIRASIDYNLVVDDELIIRAMEGYETEFGVEFLERITKETFVNDPRSREIATRLVEERNGKIFRDIVDGKYKSITVDEDGVVLIR